MELKSHLPEPLGFDGKYVHYPIKLAGLPAKIHIRGDELLLKSEFHCSLISIDKLGSDFSLDGQVLLDAFGELAAKHPLTFGSYKSELRIVHRDERKSIVVMCEIDGLAYIFNQLQQQFALDLPMQPMHVTLYTLQYNAGIGISSKEDLARITEKLEAEEDADLKKQMNFDAVFGVASNG